MKRVILLAALIWVAEFAKAQTPTPPPGVIETYKVVNGMSIRATVYNVADGQRHRVAIAIHGGSYSSGTMQTNVAQDVSQYGFMGVAIEYSQASPHIEMNTPEHPFPGQNDIHDDGHYPEQTDDVGDAIVHYRNDPRSIWPKGRPDPKPSLDAVMSQTQLENKVAGYLRDSLVLEDYWQTPITAEQLQAEMDRMARDTKQPEILRELFEALGNDTIDNILEPPYKQGSGKKGDSG